MNLLYTGPTMIENDSERQQRDAELIREQRAIERGARLHWFHWAVLLLSLLLTLAAWQYAKTQADRIAGERFDVAADQVLELLTERMRKYEEALRAGVASMYAHGGDMTLNEWITFTDSLQIEKVYPGINGMGVIYRVPRESVADFLDRQRVERPGFRIHPPHTEPVLYPITYIEPFETNARAVGLDMAHEINRYTAAKKARDTGMPRITGPIVLVQDSERTPGFLFFSPFYSGDEPKTLADRRARLTGLVYAPFIFSRLIEGTLEKEKRDVSIRVLDGETVMYDELKQDEANFDDDPLFSRRNTVAMYGRDWDFDIQAAQSFRASFSTDQPLFILAGGIVIDALLLVLFVSLTRANRRAGDYARRVSKDAQDRAVELREMVGDLAKSNQELERFAYVASHDLQEPLRMVRNFTALLETKYGDKLDDDGRKYIEIASSSAKRMNALINDLLEYARIDVDTSPRDAVDLNETLDYVLTNLADSIETARASVTSDHLPVVHASSPQLARVLQNLISNGLKYQATGVKPVICVSATHHAAQWTVCVSDNGIGIPAEFQDSVFEPFRRLHGKDAYAGTGMGLAICRRIVEGFGGRIWVESEDGKGSRFYFSIPTIESK